MKALWENIYTLRFVDWILIQCYMGWRSQELAKLGIENVNLECQYITGGMKTSASKNRIVQDLVQRNYDQAVGLSSQYLFNAPLAIKGGMTITYDKYVIKRLIGHRITDITEGTYTECDIEWLRAELEKMP